MSVSAILFSAARALRPLYKMAPIVSTTAEPRYLSMLAPLWRRRRQTPNDDFDCVKCNNEKKCFEKKNCMDPFYKKKIRKCSPYPNCKNKTCRFVDPRAYQENKRAGAEIEEQQMWQAREERRLYKCLPRRGSPCAREKIRRKRKCPKDHSDPRKY